MLKKHKVVLASLLKPIDDPRMFEKIGVSMAETNKYAINIIGFSTKNKVSHPNIRFHPIFNFRRKSLQRLLAPLRYWQKLLQLKPEVIIVNSHDLLIVSCAFKILFGSKILYDVQENYKRNIIWSSDLPKPFRLLAAYAVRGKENLCSRMIDHFFAAERCYMNECSFITSNALILENKALLLPGKEVVQENSSIRSLKLIYSGTIAETYGVFDCIELADQFTHQGLDCQLTIIGYCPRRDTLQKVREMAVIRPYIRLLGGEGPVPHEQILEELQKTDFALISYRLNPSNEGCFPTRIWECLAYKVPMLMKKEHPWGYLLDEYEAGYAIDFHHPPVLPPPPLLSFYRKKPIPSSFYWEYEEKKLLETMETLF